MGQSIQAGWAPSAGVGCSGWRQPCKGEHGSVHVHRLVNMRHSRKFGMCTGRPGSLVFIGALDQGCCMLVGQASRHQQGDNAIPCVHVFIVGGLKGGPAKALGIRVLGFRD